MPIHVTVPPPENPPVSALLVDADTGAIEGPVTASEFAAANDLGGGGGGGGNVSNSGTPTNGQAAEWTDSTHVKGVAVTGTGSYVKSADAALTGAPTAPTADPGTDTEQIATTAFVLANGGGGGGGNVSNSGTPVAGQVAEWVDATHVQGAAVTGTGSYVKSFSGTLTGLPLAPTAAPGTVTTQIATTAFAGAAATAAGAAAVATLGTSFQEWDVNRPSLPANAFDDDFLGSVVNAKWTSFRAATAGMVPTVLCSWITMQMSVAAESKSGYVQAVSGDWTLVGRVKGLGGLGNTCSVGICIAGDLITSPNTAPLSVIQVRRAAADTNGAVEVAKYTNATTFSTSPFLLSGIPGESFIFLRIVKVGTNVTFDYSQDGVIWVNAVPAAAIGFTVVTAGISVSRQNTGGTAFTAVVDWVRMFTGTPNIGGLDTRFIAP